MSNGSPTPTSVDLTFYDNLVPLLKAAQYTITVSQTLAVDTAQTQQDGGNPNIQSPPQPPISQTLIVRGPRFAIDPADVHRVFPPQNGSGVYDEYLPLIVFNKRALPWERALNVNVPNAASYPWLALLVFAEDELLIPQPASGSATPPPPNSQANPTRSASFPLNNIVHATFNTTPTAGPPPGILGPTLNLEADEDPSQIFCNVIDVDVATFAALIPTINDLPFLAHVRQVSTDNKEPLNSKHDGWFATAFSNRFAIPPADSSTTQQRNIAHLVSLEGLEPYLGVDAPITPSGFQKVRLISLYSWTFTCLPDPQENFRELMLNLISTESEQGTDLLLRVPLPDTAALAASEAEQSVVARIQNGYTPLSYATWTGEQTFAWYRGPLAAAVTERFLATPDPDAPDNPDVPFNSSEAMVYDPATGLFDQSYAVAFQTGRSLALANLTFSTSLLQWRREAHALVDTLMEYLRSPSLLSVLQSDQILDANGNLTNVGVDDLAALLNANLVSNAFIDFLATDFGNSIAAQIGEAGGFTPADQSQQPTDPVTPQPVVPADLSQLMQDPTVVALIQQLSGLQVGSGTTQQFEASILPEQVVEWLAQLALLYGVPFNNLVPNVRMLPQESIRFFYIDQNWIDSLIDGALSVGLQSSRDSLFQQLMRDPLHRSVDDVLYQVRNTLRGVSSSETSPPLGTMAGFVLRSMVVAGWPGLEVRAWSAADSTNPMQPLRLDRVSPSVMIGIYPDTPVKIEFNEPSEGLVFGFEDEGIALRYLPGTQGAAPDTIGQVINPTAPIWLTPTELQSLKRAQPANQPVLNIAGSGGLVAALQSKFPSPQPTLSPASLAVLMVRVPEQMLFEPEYGANQ